MYNIPDNFYKAILSQHPDAQNLRVPDVQGSLKNIFFADVDGKTYAFKFGQPDLVKKNERISALFKIRKIPCPDICAREFNDLYFEEYEVLPGISLFDAVKNGMSADKIRQIYREILDNIEKMSHIPGRYVLGNDIAQAHKFAKSHVTNTNGPVLGQICMALVYMLNLGDSKNKALFHSDITPKNTIVSEDGHLVGFVDIDSVTTCDINYAFAMMAAKYIQMGLDINDLFLYYQKISGKLLNQGRIRKMADAINFAKTILWKRTGSRQK